MARFDGETGVDSDGIVDFTVTFPSRSTRRRLVPRTSRSGRCGRGRAPDGRGDRYLQGLGTPDPTRVAWKVSRSRPVLISAWPATSKARLVVVTRRCGIDEQVDDVSAQADVDTAGPAATISVSESLVDAGNAVTVVVYCCWAAPSAADDQLSARLGSAGTPMWTNIHRDLRCGYGDQWHR